MKVVIIEDEKIAADQLKTLIIQHDPDVEIRAIISTVTKSVNWLAKNNAPDLIFMDIQLADGLSFEIFEKTKVNTPVIFTTAYDQYAIRAFKVNSIDYLLKPIDYDELVSAIEKYKGLNKSRKNTSIEKFEEIERAVKMITRQYKSRFAVKIGEHIYSVDIDDIELFFSEEKSTFAQTKNGRKYIIDYSLDEIEALVDPGIFFRINRKYIIAIHSIKNIVSFSNSRLKLHLHRINDDKMIVSREKVADFKEWLDR